MSAPHKHFLLPCRRLDIAQLTPPTMQMPCAHSSWNEEPHPSFQTTQPEHASTHSTRTRFHPFDREVYKRRNLIDRISPGRWANRFGCSIASTHAGGGSSIAMTATGIPRYVCSARRSAATGPALSTVSLRLWLLIGGSALMDGAAALRTEAASRNRPTTKAPRQTISADATSRDFGRVHI
jgi:hypothetical protein